MRTKQVVKGQQQRGFTLVEALVSLIVMAFGMFAIASFQITMSRNSEVAKQRAEALRLAQQKMEELRSFQTVTSDGVGGNFDYVSDISTLAAGSAETPTVTSNTTYRRSWSVTKNDGVTAAAGTDHEKWINMLVTWNDRSGQPQEVRLLSIISRSDPIDLGTLFTGPGAGKTRQPKNRNINIPYPAIDLAGDKSAFLPPGATVAYVFDNATGDVLGSCTTTPTAGSTVTFGQNGCTGFSEPAYLLSGYVRFVSSYPSLSSNEKLQDEAITNPTQATKRLDVSIAFISPSTSASEECFEEQQKVVGVTGTVSPVDISSASRTSGVTHISYSGSQSFTIGQYVSINGVSAAFNGTFKVTNSSSTGSKFVEYSQSGLPDISSFTPSGTATAQLVTQVAVAEVESPPGYTQVLSRYVAYTCVVHPVDHDSNPQTRSIWSGQIKITPNAADNWALGTDDLLMSPYTVCRYTGDYKADNLISNSENPLYHRHVTGTLDNQNFFIVPTLLYAASGCWDDSEADPLGDDFVNTNTVLHQNTALGSSPFGGATSSDSDQWGGTGETGSETADTVFPML